MDDCIFCKIVKGEIPSTPVFEDEHVLAFLDIRPVTYGHTLVIPKAHHVWLYDTPDELLAHIMKTVKFLMPRLRDAMESETVTVSVVGIDVPHFHVHLIPRRPNDGLPRWPELGYKDNEMQTVAEKIKAALV
jgi:histidine triad (HIT) family protein